MGIAMSQVHEFIHDEAGATSIEYAMIGTLISIIAIAALSSMGSSLNTMFSGVILTAWLC